MFLIFTFWRFFKSCILVKACKSNKICRGTKPHPWALLLTTVYTVLLLFFFISPSPFFVFLLPYSSSFAESQHLVLVTWFFFSFSIFVFISHKYCCLSFCSVECCPCFILVSSTKSMLLTSVFVLHSHESW